MILSNVGGTLANTGVGSVTVTDNGPVLLVGDSFTLFSEAVANGAALTINPVVRGEVGRFALRPTISPWMAASLF